jgi:predicted DNA-binding antitoxin AbrB/MazE fold protein
MVPDRQPGDKAKTIIVDAIYENGVLRPMQALALQEQVRVTVEPKTSWAERMAGMVGWTGSHEDLEKILAEAEESETLP